MDENTQREARASGKCPICGGPRRPQHRPFCSPRCADVDLQRWLSGRYAIPAAEEDEGVPEPSESAGEG